MSCQVSSSLLAFFSQLCRLICQTAFLHPTLAYYPILKVGRMNCANINETFKWTILQAFFKHLSVPFPSSTTYSEIVHKYCNKAIWGTWLINQTLNLDNLMVSKSDIIWLSLCPLVDVELPILVPSLTCLLSCLSIYKSLGKISVSE